MTCFERLPKLLGVPKLLDRIVVSINVHSSQIARYKSVTRFGSCRVHVTHNQVPATLDRSR